MNENLFDMVQEQGVNEPPQVFSEKDLSLPEADSTVEETEEVVDTTPAVPTIGVSALSDWFGTNCETFDNINEVNVSIRGVDPTNTLIMAVKEESDELDGEGNEKRILRVFDNADMLPILNLPGSGMDIYNKGFQVTYDYDEDTFIKCYGIKFGLIVVFCNKINDQAIPHHIARLKKKDSEVEVVSNEVEPIVQKLTEDIDVENLHILYPQSSKAEGLTTIQSAVDWLLERQSGVTDINHLLQIDNVIITILT